MSALLPPPGQRAPTKLPGAPSAAVLAGREIFLRAWVYAVAIDEPDEVTADDAARRVATLVRELMLAQMESTCAAVCVNCQGIALGAGVWVKPASVYVPDAIADWYSWTHEWGIDGAERRGYLPCSAASIREAFRKGIWSDAIE